MATNDFQTFAGGVGANVLSQSDWLALAALGAGFSSGVAPSAACNKAWRQSSIMSSVLAQLIVANTGQNATDDGTTATLLTNLLAAIRAQSLGVVGQVRNLKASQTTAAATLTLTADQIIVGAGLTGLTYALSSFNKTVNLATTGAGGMDTGSAPVSGYVALYAIYNPTTQTSALLATNATSSVAPTIYGGANMPAGYTASALVSVWPTNASGQFVVGIQNDRRISGLLSTALTTSSAAASLTALSISNSVPPNARWIRGTTNIQNGSTTPTSVAINVASNASGIGQQYNQGYLSTTSQLVQNFTIDLITSQQVYYLATTTPNVSATYSIYITAYEF